MLLVEMNLTIVCVCVGGVSLDLNLRMQYYINRSSCCMAEWMSWQVLKHMQEVEMEGKR